MPTWSKLILVILVCSSVSCTKKPAVVVLPDSRILTPAVICPKDVTCAMDPGRLTIDKGYLREIMQDLTNCSKPGF